MKSQDIFILLKLVSLSQQEEFGEILAAYDSEDMIRVSDRYSARGLAAALGISKTEVNASINRSIAVGMAKHERETGYPRANKSALVEFICHGLKYVFPVKPAEIVRGIPTAFAAPGLEGVLMSAGDYIYVWPDAKGKDKGQSVTPLFKSVPEAAKKDPRLYEYLALVDAIRLGNPRESKLAISGLEERLKSR